ncbi:MAG: hypothetical protein HYW25_04655 [Candidatus Aenigmarchaeota archaeon]|nr:hypothetical protein [Candidatus Aenigmarchaeota archaeon]
MTERKMEIREPYRAAVQSPKAPDLMALDDPFAGADFQEFLGEVADALPLYKGARRGCYPKE